MRISDCSSAVCSSDLADCPNRSENGVITGRDPGGTSSGPAVIKAFEHAYFVQRSGVQARAVAAPLARVPTAEQIQTGIASGLVPDRKSVASGKSGAVSGDFAGGRYLKKNKRHI